ncbi:MAG: stress response translation initiation inhibitor YciH [Nanoarchaeota archaeon]
MDICPKCGLPKQACVCEEIVKSEQRIHVQTVKRKFGKVITIVSGLSSEVDVKHIAKELKSILACGGTVKNNEIELQGDHLRNVGQALVKLGFADSAIEVK